MKRIKRYTLNPAAVTESLWIPQIYQIIAGHKNKSYLNSLWLGVGWNILSLPYRVATEFLWPLFNFKFLLCLMSIVVIPVTVFTMFLAGVAGQLMAMRVTIEQMIEGEILTPRQGAAALSAGYTLPLVDWLDFLMELRERN